MKSLFAALLILNILTCPLRCLSCEAIAAIDENVSVAACSCCHAEACPTEFPASKIPVPCDDGCNCQDCFCEGAVVESGPEWIVAAFESMSWDFLALDLNQPDDSAFLLAEPDHAALHGRFICGRDARISLQSLLI